jgi:acyl-CoA thioester hydrolase
MPPSGKTLRLKETMLTHRTEYRVIYGDTDTMGVAYYANYLRWFEIGRTELFRALGLTYRIIEERGIFLPVSEAYCKYVSGARYDDLVIIETRLDASVRAGMKFDYTLLGEGEKTIATGFTRHACVNREGKVVRPPPYLMEMIRMGGSAATA